MSTVTALVIEMPFANLENLLWVSDKGPAAIIKPEKVVGAGSVKHVTAVVSAGDSDISSGNISAFLHNLPTTTSRPKVEVNAILEAGNVNNTVSNIKPNTGVAMSVPPISNEVVSETTVVKPLLTVLPDKHIPETTGINEKSSSSLSDNQDHSIQRAQIQQPQQQQPQIQQLKSQQPQLPPLPLRISKDATSQKPRSIVYQEEPSYTRIYFLLASVLVILTGVAIHVSLTDDESLPEDHEPDFAAHDSPIFSSSAMQGIFLHQGLSSLVNLQSILNILIYTSI
jgi:hypothetical protein